MDDKLIDTIVVYTAIGFGVICFVSLIFLMGTFMDAIKWLF